MSALTSSIALQLVGGLGIGERLLELGLPGRVRREGVARRGEAALVEHDELLGDLAHRLARTRALLALPVAAASRLSARLLAAGVGRDRVDLVRRDVEPVAAAVLEQQVVALGAADRARHHAAVAGDAVDVVHDVARPARGRRRSPRPARGRARGTRCGRRRPVRSASASTASFDAVEDEAAVERRDDDVHPGRRSSASRRGSSTRIDREPLAVEHVGECARRSLRRRRATTTR